ncbi:MAG: histidine--tRNA ligase, partial [Actinobacteria bacterium]|nr:histidine--tRNA ligase [Actinomycetota bacterium]
MSELFKAPKGTYDVVPPFSALWLAVRDALSTPPRNSGYGYIETPIFEDTALFVRGVGESTDVVSKEMYTFEDKGGRSLTLKPEGTAGVLRAMLENRMDRGALPAKVWYTGPHFRYEQPQSGRYRQHTQVGVETIGSSDPAIDAEVIWMAAYAQRNILGLKQVRILINSLGCHECRPGYRELLIKFLASCDLDEATRARAQINPLRVLDDKRKEVQTQLADAPLMPDHLCADCTEHHEKVLGYLDELGVIYEKAPRLVRGLDYYVRTTFECVHDGLGAQSAIGGGGRYDGLIETLGGPAIGGVGFGLGVDRTCLAVQAEGIQLFDEAATDVFFVPVGDAAITKVVGLAGLVRAAGINSDIAYDGRSIKAAMKSADRS